MLVVVLPVPAIGVELRVVLSVVVILLWVAELLCVVGPFLRRRGFMMVVFSVVVEFVGLRFSAE